MNGVFFGVLGLGGDPGMDAEDAAPIERPRIVDLHNGFRCCFHGWRNAGAGTIGRAEIAAQGCLSRQHRIKRQGDKKQQKE